MLVVCTHNLDSGIDLYLTWPIILYKRTFVYLVSTSLALMVTGSKTSLYHRWRLDRGNSNTVYVEIFTVILLLEIVKKKLALQKYCDSMF